MADFKVLLVEDEPAKSRVVAQAILSLQGVHPEQLVVVGDVVSAKRELSQGRFDLFLLDINLPRRVDEPPLQDGGLDVLRWLKNRPSEIAPKLTVVLTAYEESLALVSAEFDNLLIKAVRFAFDDDRWRISLQNCVRELQSQCLPPFRTDGSTFNTALGLVVALDQIEMSALRSLDLGWETLVLPTDDARYFSVRRDRALFEYIAVASSNMGMAAAAIATTKLINAFQPEYVGMCGICAGRKGDVALGDPILADPCWDWGSGKVVEKAGTPQTKIAPYQTRIHVNVREAGRSLSEDKKFFEDLHREFNGFKPNSPPVMHIGAVASGASVISAAQKMKEISDHQHRKLLGVDMELSAVADACAYSTKPRPTFIPLKAVSDFGDGKKNDKLQAYAAVVSAKTLMELHRRLSS